MTTISGRFDLTSWDEEVIEDAEGAKLVRVRNTKSFVGGIVGTSAAELLQALAQDGSAAYVGIERSPHRSTAARARSCCAIPRSAARTAPATSASTSCPARPPATSRACVGS
jgi:hypothetical protein